MHAVVFDFDGVIARSMEQHAEAYRRLLRPYDVDVRDEEVFEQEGARSESIIRDLLRRAGRDHDDVLVRRLGDEKQVIFRALGTPDVYDGARAMVRAVQDVVATALVTGTRRENLDSIIPDLIGGFDAVLAQADYTEDKPHPEPYAKAAQALGIDPSACIAVENAVRGVQSATAAGYGHVAAITTTMPASALTESGAHAVLSDHVGLRDHVLTLIQER